MALDVSEARAAALSLELKACRLSLAEREAELARETEEHQVTKVELASITNFQVLRQDGVCLTPEVAILTTTLSRLSFPQKMLDDKDNQDRASRAVLVHDMYLLKEEMKKEQWRNAELKQVSERAKTGMFGLRAQLQAATDTIDGARRDNEALLKPLRDKIEALEATVAEDAEALEEQKAKTAAAREETAAAAAAERMAKADFEAAGVAANAAAVAKDKAEKAFTDLQQRMADEIATEV